MNRNDFEDDYRYNTDDRYGDFSQSYSEINYDTPNQNGYQQQYVQNPNSFNQQWSRPQGDSYYGLYDNGSNKFERLRKKYPDIRIATVQDGKVKLFGVVSLGILFIILGIAVFIVSYFQGEAEKDFFAHADTVSGTILSTHYRRTGRKHTRTVYDITFQYEYHGTDYIAEETLSDNNAKHLEVTSDSAVGRTVTVYVDSREPSSAKIFKGSGQPEYFVLIFPLVGVVVIIWGIVDYDNCKKGKIAIYRRGKKTVWTKIK